MTPVSGKLGATEVMSTVTFWLLQLMTTMIPLASSSNLLMKVKTSRSWYGKKVLPRLKVF